MRAFSPEHIRFEGARKCRGVVRRVLLPNCWVARERRVVTGQTAQETV